MIDTAALQDQGTTTGTSLEGAPGSQRATHLKPRPRKVKERIYREVIAERQKQTPIDLTAWAVETVKMLRSRDSEARRQHNRDVATFYQYFDCNEYGEFNEAGQWISDAQNQDDDDFAYSVPIVPAHVDSAKTLLLKTALEYEYAGTNKISVLDGQVAAMVKELAEEEMQRIFTDDLRIREMLYLLLAGTSYRHHYWARNLLEPETTEVPEYSTEEVAGATFRVCGNPECGATLKGDDELCTRCMGDQINTVTGGKTQKTTAKNKTVTLAQNQMYVPNPLSVQHDLSKININSSFVVERDALPRGEAEHLYSQVIPTNRNSISEEVQLVRELERARLRTTNLMSDQDNAALRSLFNENGGELVERERGWLLPWQYANVIINEDHWYYTKADGLFWCEDEKDLPDNAEKIKRGTFLGDRFRDGLFLCVIDDNSIEMNSASVADNWIKLIFGARPANSDGAGMRRLRPLGDMANDATNLEFKVLMDDADPKTFLDKSYLSFLAKVGEYNVVDSLKEGHTWENVVHRLPGAAAHPQLGAINERVQAFAQFLAGTFSSMGPGAPDVKAMGTATGVVEMAEQATGRYLEAILTIKAADIESRFKVVTNIKKNSIDAQKQELAKRFGQEVAKRFFTANLRKIVSIKAKAGTDQPVSQAIKIAKLQAYGEAVSKIGENNPNAASLTQSFGEMMDMPVTVGIGLADKEEAGRRIGVLREKSEQFSEKQLKVEEVIISAMGLVTDVLAEAEHDIPVDQIEVGPQQQPMMPAPPMPMNGNGVVPALPPGPEGPPMMDEPDAAPHSPVPSVIMMQTHTVFMDAYRDELLTEAARGSNTVYKTSLQLMWKLHYAREVEKQKELMRIEGEKQMVVEQMKVDFAAKNAPPELPQPSPEEIAGLEKQAKDDDASTRIMEGVTTKMMDDAAKDADMEREQDAKDADLDRDTLKAEHAAELSKETEAMKMRAKETNASTEKKAK